MAHYSKEHQNIYIDITRTASSTISRLYFVGKELFRQSHGTLDHTKKALDEEEYKLAFKWSVVRNPYTRAVSLFFKKRASHYGRGYNVSNIEYLTDFGKFLNHLFKSDYRVDLPGQMGFAIPFCSPQWHFVSDSSGDLLADYLGKMEEMEDSIKHVCNQINVKPPSFDDPDYSHANGGQPGEVGEHDQVNHLNYTDHLDPICYYDTITIDMVNQLYREDFENLDYSKIKV